jgi:hypothetical protein
MELLKNPLLLLVVLLVDDGVQADVDHDGRKRDGEGDAQERPGVDFMKPFRL